MLWTTDTIFWRGTGRQCHVKIFLARYGKNNLRTHRKVLIFNPTVYFWQKKFEVVGSNPTAKPLYFYTYFHSLQNFCPKFILKYVLNSLRSTLQGYSRDRPYTVQYVYVNLEKRPKNTQKITYGTINHDLSQIFSNIKHYLY